MQGWFWQTIIGIIVTVVGTVIANSIVRGRSARVNRIALGNTPTTPMELRTTSSFSPRRHVHISAAGSGHRQRMQGWFSQIIIGIIVTVVGTVIANSIVRGPGGRHFMSGVHFSGPTRR